MQNWKRNVALLGLFLINMTNSEMVMGQEAEKEIRRIRAFSNQERKAGNSGTISKYYTEDIIIVKGDGGELIGRQTVDKYMNDLKQRTPDLYFERSPDKIVVAGSNKKAWEEGVWKGYNQKGELPDYGGRYSMMWVNTEDGWKMRAQQFVNLKQLQKTPLFIGLSYFWDMQNPWKKLSTKHIYSNPWIDVEEHQVINPRGGKGIYGKVHFKNTAIGIIPLDDQQNTWLVGQYRYTLDEYSWEIPMGGGALNNDALDSAKRELKEETGLSANQWEKVLRIHTSNSVTDEEGFVFIARDLVEGEVEFDETEDLEVKKLPFVHALRMVIDGEITDSLSIAGIYAVARKLNL